MRASSGKQVRTYPPGTLRTMDTRSTPTTRYTRSSLHTPLRSRHVDKRLPASNGCMQSMCMLAATVSLIKSLFFTTLQTLVSSPRGHKGRPCTQLASSNRVLRIRPSTPPPTNALLCQPNDPLAVSSYRLGYRRSCRLRDPTCCHVTFSVSVFTAKSYIFSAMTQLQIILVSFAACLYELSQ